MKMLAGCPATLVPTKPRGAATVQLALAVALTPTDPG
jgi:hypothetical protein